MCGVWTREEGRGEAGPAWEGQMAAAAFRFTGEARLAAEWGRRGGKKKTRGQWVGRGRALEQMPGEQWGF